jgi:hypothetical protein
VVAADKVFVVVSPRAAGVVVVGVVGARAAAPVLSDVGTAGKGLTAFWAMPGASAPLANIIPKTQPVSIRVFIEPH